MLHIGISEFRANMNAVLEKVQQGEIVVLTSRGTQVAKIVPPDYAQASALAELERLRETAYVGDVLSPTDEEWDASR